MILLKWKWICHSQIDSLIYSYCSKFWKNLIFKRDRSYPKINVMQTRAGQHPTNKTSQRQRWPLTLSWRRSLSYTNQSSHLLCKSVDRFPCDRDSNERVKCCFLKTCSQNLYRIHKKKHPCRGPPLSKSCRLEPCKSSKRCMKYWISMK